jgi:ferredoxin--NADP+ reductase
MPGAVHIDDFHHLETIMTDLGSEARPLRVAVVGSGPAGFYVVEALFKSERALHVDMFDRLPTPYGLVRAGVAPDHQKLKSVIRIYQRLSSDERFHFFGNVTVGRDVSVQEIRSHYDAVVFSSGAETDRRLGIPGEDLAGSHTATEFVGWYNGHPDYQDRVFDLSREVAVVIGQGNVAMDVSRILAKTTDELKDTDITQHALEVLAESKVKEIHVIGRRGPVQAKFTPPEIKEIGILADCDPVIDPADLEVGESSQGELDDPKNTHSRKNMATLQEFTSRPEPTKSKSYHMKFFLSPTELQGDGRVERMVLEKNRLVGEPFQQWAEGTGETFTMDCDILFRSVGYRGVPIPGLPFDEKRGVVPSREGRVTDNDTVLSGVYVSGWIKRGPSGVIGTNKPDSYETVKAILDDLPNLAPCSVPDSGALKRTLASRGVRVVSLEDWQKIDKAEVERGKARGKPREKFVRVEEMLDLLG